MLTFDVVVRNYVHLYTIIVCLNRWHNETKHIWHLEGNLVRCKTGDGVVCTVTLLSCTEDKEIEDDGLSSLITLL